MVLDWTLCSEVRCRGFTGTRVPITPRVCKFGINNPPSVCVRMFRLCARKPRNVELYCATRIFFYPSVYVPSPANRTTLARGIGVAALRLHHLCSRREGTDVPADNSRNAWPGCLPVVERAPKDSYRG